MRQAKDRVKWEHFEGGLSNDDDVMTTSLFFIHIIRAIYKMGDRISLSHSF